MTTSLADKEEIERFAESVQSYLDLNLDAERFTAIRLQHGIYGQRQEGVHMVRIKLPGGLINPAQLDAIADVAEKLSERDVGHLTTRQDIQVHYVPLANTPDAMRRLAEVGLTTREACGNTVRNVTACPLAGICPHEHTDITKHLDGAVRHFLRNPLNQQMPRKFKISFSGCETDCAQGMIHDLGVVAVRQGERFGFRVLAGGGLGHKPHEALTIESFIEESDLLLVMEAVIALHNRYSDRTKRAKSRIKFLVDKFGPEGFIARYREELAHVRAALGASGDYPRGEWAAGKPDSTCTPGAPRTVVAQKQPGLLALPIAVPLGDLGSRLMRGLSRLMTQLGLREIRATQDQNLLLPNLSAGQLTAARAGIAALGLSEPRTGDDVVACPGTSTCRLGITSSTVVAPRLSGGTSDLRLRVSGCHNGCAQPESGDIGIYGEGKRLHGKLIPHYQTYFGGDGRSGGGLAIKGPSVPSIRITTAVERIERAYANSRKDGESFFSWAHGHDKQYFTELLADLLTVTPEDLPHLARDHGLEGEFKVLQLGGGECAGVSQVLIGSNFFAAAHERNYRDALLFQRKYDESAQCAEAVTRLLGDNLAQLVGAPRQERLADIVAALAVIPAESDLSAQLADLAQAFTAPAEDFTEATLKPIYAQLDAFTVALAERCIARGVPLDLTGALPLRAARLQQAARAEAVRA